MKSGKADGSRDSCLDSALGSFCALVRQRGAERPAPNMLDWHDWQTAQPILCSVIKFFCLSEIRSPASWINEHPSMHYAFPFLFISLCGLHPAILLIFFPCSFPSYFSSSSVFLSPSVSCSLSFCSVRQDNRESHVVVMPGCKVAYVDDSFPYVAKERRGQRGDAT